MSGLIIEKPLFVFALLLKSVHKGFIPILQEDSCNILVFSTKKKRLKSHNKNGIIRDAFGG